MTTWDLVFRLGGALLALGFAYLERRKLAVSNDQKSELRQQTIFAIAKTAWQAVEAAKQSGNVASGIDAEAMYLGQVADTLAQGGATPLSTDEVAGLSAYAKMQSMAGKYVATYKNGTDPSIKLTKPAK